MGMGCNVMASGALFFQVVLNTFAALVVQDVEFWTLSAGFEFGVNVFIRGNHTLVFAVFHCNHENRIEFVRVRNKNVVFLS